MICNEQWNLLSNKEFTTKESPRLGGLLAKFYESAKEELTQMFLTLFHKIEKEGTEWNSLDEASISRSQQKRKL
jgi:hypothetical protein